MSQNFSKQTCDVCCIHCEESHYLKETMDEFIPVSPNGKPALCLEDLRKFSVKELQGKLKHYHENISEKKTDLLMRIFVIFCCYQPKLQSQQLPSDSLMDHTTCCT